MTFPLGHPTDIRNLPLPRRAVNCLIKANILTLEDVRREFGEKLLARIRS